MKITFTDTNINVELEISNDKLKSAKDVEQAAFKIARAFVDALTLQGVMVPDTEDDASNEK